MVDTTAPLNVLVWHVHGSWTTSFVNGRHRYLLPTLSDGGPWGRGKCGRDWPAAREVSPDLLSDIDVDVVVLQRPEELEMAERWLGRRPGRDVPAIYVEHNTPREHAANTRHPMSGQSGIGLVHVTHFNQLCWDNGACRTTVIPHGIVDPGERYTGELARAAALINEPIRRWRVTGTDLLPAFGAVAPVDVYGIGASDLQDPFAGVYGIADLEQHELHRELAQRRVYLHTARWTSLGLSLLEAMHLGMPVVAIAATEAVTAVPPEAGVISTDLGELTTAMRDFVNDADLAAFTGKLAREFALRHYGLDAFLRRWDEQLAELVR